MTAPAGSVGLDWLRAPVLVPDETARSAALARQASLTKPPGSLGRLEALVVHLASLQGCTMPRVERVRIAVFAADHGVAADGVSAFPQAVTRQMLGNFAAGGAAICVLARELGADLELVDLGTVAGPLDLPGVRNAHLGAGSANLARGPALSGEQLALALGEGRAAVQRALADGAELFIAGEMGIGNTTAAAALACTLLGRPGVDLTGPGTGLDRQGVARKTAVVDRALELHRDALVDPYEALRRLGGFEIAAMTGAYVACAQLGVPALVDGFIAGVAALAAVRLCSGAKDWLLYAHNSAEPGHALVLETLAAKPLLALDLRLGEGSGAALALPLLRLACAMHADMATFGEAGVTDRRPAGG